MAITTQAQLRAALAQRRQKLVLAKNAAVASNGMYQDMSLIGGTAPLALSGPTGLVGSVCTNGWAGSIGFAPAPPGMSSYLADMICYGGGPNVDWEIHDRIAHVGGVSSNTTATQALSFDLATMGVGHRIGEADYSDVQIWGVPFTAVSAAAGISVTVIYNDGTTELVSSAAIFSGGTIGRLYAIKPGPVNPHKFVRGIQDCTFNVASGTAGNFGFVATRFRCGIPNSDANDLQRRDAFSLGFPKIPDDAYLMAIALPQNVTTTGAPFINLTMVQG